MPSVTLVVGPSGSGKTTLVRALSAKHSDIVVPVAYTTRRPRHGEVDSVDYRFVSDNEFPAEGELLTSIEFNGKRYGYTKAEFSKRLQHGKRVLATVDRTGVSQVRLVYNDTAAVFLDVLPEDQRRRIGRRESRASAKARHEIAEIERNWARKNVSSVIIVPAGLALKEVQALVEPIIFG